MYKKIASAILISITFILLPSPVMASFSNNLPFGQTGSWNMIFEDNFEGSSLDITKWRPNWLSGSDTSITPPINSSEINCYDPSNATVSNGVLLLSAKLNSNANCKDRSGAVAPYSSGIVESHGKIGGDFTYGYVEARIQNPAGTLNNSFWPAFWTDGSGMNWPTTGEIDVMECYGTDASCSYHYHYSGGGPGGNATVAGSTTGFHIYAVNWEPNKITWYYDGVQVWQTTTGVISVPHFLIANLGVKGSGAVFPASMKVDYIRVWQRGSDTIYKSSDQEPDGDVDGDDFNTLVSNFGLSGIIGWLRSDIIKDGVVNIFDFNKLITDFGL